MSEIGPVQQTLPNKNSDQLPVLNRLTDIFAVGKFDYDVMLWYQNLTRKPKLFRALLGPGPGTMYPLNPLLAGPSYQIEINWIYNFSVGILDLRVLYFTEVESRTQGSRPRPRTAFPRTDPLEAKNRNARGQGPVLEYSSTVLVLEYNSSTIFWVLVLVLGTPGTRLVLVLEGQCTRYSVKKSAEHASTFGLR